MKGVSVTVHELNEAEQRLVNRSTCDDKKPLYEQYKFIFPTEAATRFDGRTHFNILCRKTETGQRSSLVLSFYTRQRRLQRVSQVLLFIGTHQWNFACLSYCIN